MSKARWTKVALSEIENDDKVGPHKWTTFKSRFLSWPYCLYCGLIILNNPIAQRLAKHSCPPWNYYDANFR